MWQLGLVTLLAYNVVFIFLRTWYASHVGGLVYLTFQFNRKEIIVLIDMGASATILPFKKWVELGYFVLSIDMT